MKFREKSLWYKLSIVVAALVVACDSLCSTRLWPGPFLTASGPLDQFSFSWRFPLRTKPAGACSRAPSLLALVRHVYNFCRDDRQ